MENNVDNIIFKLLPHFEQTLWGGESLKKIFGKESDLEYIAESWELSAYTGKESRVFYNGESVSLSDLIEKLGKEILGNTFLKAKRSTFPIMIKFIDAARPLSIQIHPGDDYAYEHEGENGKTEMWYIVSAKPDAYIYYGLKDKVTKDEIRKSIEDGSLPDLVCKIPVKAGDVFFVNSGIIHAIGDGIIICEIQQSSNITYRMYDFNRIDRNGKKRDLHIDKALDVVDIDMNVSASDEAIKRNKKKKDIGYGIERLVSCDYFDTSFGKSDGSISFDMTKDSFAGLVFLKGEGEVEAAPNGNKCKFKAGDSFFICASDKKISIDGSCEFLLITL